jgi:hypothetical protein
MPTSQNGWPVLTPAQTYLWHLPTKREVHFRLEAGWAGFLLSHLALWFAEEIERVHGGTWDDWGYAVRTIRGESTTYSNHASGTAVDINAQAHPLGVRNTFTTRQERLLLGRLRGRYDDTIRWGGTYSGRPDEMHFEVAADRAAVRALGLRLDSTARGARVRASNPGVTLR